jgi:hypothetical protein
LAEASPQFERGVLATALARTAFTSICYECRLVAGRPVCRARQRRFKSSRPTISRPDHFSLAPAWKNGKRAGLSQVLSLPGVEVECKTMNEK